MKTRRARICEIGIECTKQLTSREAVCNKVLREKLMIIESAMIQMLIQLDKCSSEEEKEILLNDKHLLMIFEKHEGDMPVNAAIKVLLKSDMFKSCNK